MYTGDVSAVDLLLVNLARLQHLNPERYRQIAAIIAEIVSTEQAEAIAFARVHCILSNIAPLPSAPSCS